MEKLTMEKLVAFVNNMVMYFKEVKYMVDLLIPGIMVL